MYEHILKLKAGPELDRMVAEKALKLPCQCVPGKVSGTSCPLHEPKPYSTDLVSAWIVLEKFDLRVGRSMAAGSSWMAGTPWVAGISIYSFIGVGDEDGRADTAPLAICQAAISIAEQRESRES